MELVDIFRLLARQRLALALLFVVAGFVGVMVQYRVTLSPFGLSERVSTANTAQVRLLLDAPEEPPAIDLDSGVADTLGLRAGLLADLMATDAVKKAIAKRAGISPAELAVLPPASEAPPLPIPLAVAAADAARLTSEPYAMAIAADPSVPIVSFVVAAPDTRGARRVASAATDAYGDLVAARVTRGFRLNVEQLGPVRTRTTVDGLPVAAGVAAAFVIFVVGAAGLALLVGLGRAWRSVPRPAV